MKIHHMLTGLLLPAVAFVATSASANPIATGGSDWIPMSATDAAQVSVCVTGIINQGTQQATLIGSVKREPSTAPDGSQTVTLDFYRTGTQSINGIVWSNSSDSTVFGSQGWFVRASAGTGFVSATVTFAPPEINNTAYYEAVVYLPPGVQLLGSHTN
jgi:hypothetical protein